MSLCLFVHTLISFLFITTFASAVVPPKQKPTPSALLKGSGAKPNAKPTPITVITEAAVDCNEFPDPGYGGSDPPVYQFWPSASRIKVDCHMDVTVAGENFTYLRSNSGCYIDEMGVQAGEKDFTSLLPKCPALKPYRVYTTRNEYLLPKDGFYMDCYREPRKASQKVEVQWGARHVLCSAEGQEINKNGLWWRDAHALSGVKGYQDSHCFIPDDAFDNMVYEVEGSGAKCEDHDEKKHV